MRIPIIGKKLKIIRDLNTNHLSARAAGRIINHIKESEKKGRVILGFPGGSSVVGVYRYMNHMGKGIDWKNVHVFMADERWVPPGHRDSNHRLVKYYLGNLVKQGLNIHPFTPGKLGEYKEWFKKATEDYGKRCDLVLLSSGGDGHVASLFPNHKSIRDDGWPYIEVRGAPKPPPHRISMSRKLIEKSGMAVLLFTGEQKRAAFKTFQAGDKINECPARIVKKIKNSYVFTNLR